MDMTSFHRAFFRISLAFASFLLITSAVVLPVRAQSASSVVQKMKAAYHEQFEGVDHFVVETDVGTTYYRTVTRNGEPTFETATKMDGTASIFGENGPAAPATHSFYDQLEALGRHARHAGLETIRGVRCHVLAVEDPQTVFPDLGSEADRMTWYVDASTYQTARMDLAMKAPDAPGDGRTMTIDLKNYRTVDGITIPWRMEFDISAVPSADQRQQMDEMKKQMAKLPEEQRRMMEKMMGEQMQKQLGSLTSGAPTVVNVLRVEVNGELPAGVFSDRSSAQDRSSHPSDPVPTNAADEDRSGTEVQTLFEAVLPSQIEGLRRISVDVQDPMSSGSFVRKISAAYDTGPAMPYLVTITYYVPDSPMLARLRQSHEANEPALRIGDRAVYKRAYGGMGSGVTTFVEGPLPAVVQVRSPRLTDEARGSARPEQRSDAPRPEAALYAMRLTEVASLAESMK